MSQERRVDFDAMSKRHINPGEGWHALTNGLKLGAYADLALVTNFFIHDIPRSAGFSILIYAAIKTTNAYLKTRSERLTKEEKNRQNVYSEAKTRRAQFESEEKAKQEEYAQAKKKKEDYRRIGTVNFVPKTPPEQRTGKGGYLLVKKGG